MNSVLSITRVRFDVIHKKNLIYRPIKLTPSSNMINIMNVTGSIIRRKISILYRISVIDMSVYLNISIEDWLDVRMEKWTVTNPSKVFKIFTQIT